MNKIIHLNKKNITYTLRKSKRAKRMRLAVYCDGSVVVTTPYDLQETIADKFIKEKSKWLFSKITFFKQFQDKNIAQHNYDDYLRYKNKAYILVSDRIAYFNKFYKFPFNTINIKNQKTRWGSCSMKGNLNFNYKILFLDKKIRDYIIVHELCHLKEFNHSRKFWNLVAKTFPEWIEIKKELKINSLILQ